MIETWSLGALPPPLAVDAIPSTSAPAKASAAAGSTGNGRHAWIARSAALSPAACAPFVCAHAHNDPWGTRSKWARTRASPSSAPSSNCAAPKRSSRAPRRRRRRCWRLEEAPKTPAATPKTPAGPRAADDGDAITALRTAYGEDGGGDDGLLGGGRRQSQLDDDGGLQVEGAARGAAAGDVERRRGDGAAARRRQPAAADDDVHLLVAAMAAWPNTVVGRSGNAHGGRRPSLASAAPLAHARQPQARRQPRRRPRRGGARRRAARQPLAAHALGRVQLGRRRRRGGARRGARVEQRAPLARHLVEPDRRRRRLRALRGAPHQRRPQRPRPRRPERRDPHGDGTPPRAARRQPHAAHAAPLRQPRRRRRRRRSPAAREQQGLTALDLSSNGVGAGGAALASVLASNFVLHLELHGRLGAARDGARCWRRRRPSARAPARRWRQRAARRCTARRRSAASGSAGADEEPRGRSSRRSCATQPAPFSPRAVVHRRHARVAAARAHPAAHRLIGLLVPSLLDEKAPATPGSPFLAVAPGTPGRTPQVRFS